MNEVRHRRVGEQPALADDDQVFRGERHFAHQMRGDEDRPAFRGERLHQIADPVNSLGVQTIDGFVEHQNLGIAEQRGRDSEPLAHTEGEGLGLLPRHRAQSDGVEDFGDAARRDAIALRETEQIVVGAAAAVHRLGFEQRTDVLQGFGQFAVVLAIDPHRSARRIVEIEHHPHRGGLARPVRAQKARHHSWSDPAREPVDRNLAAETLGEAIKLDHAHTLERLRARRHHKGGTGRARGKAELLRDQRVC